MTLFLLAMLIVVILILIEIPVAFAFGIGAVFFAYITGNNISFLIPHGFKTASGFALLALPLFIFAGLLMAEGGISERLLNFVNAFVGRIKGGLGAVTVLTCALFWRNFGQLISRNSSGGPNNDSPNGQRRIPGRPCNSTCCLFISVGAAYSTEHTNDYFFDNWRFIGGCSISVHNSSRNITDNTLLRAEHLVSPG